MPAPTIPIKNDVAQTRELKMRSEDHHLLNRGLAQQTPTRDHGLIDQQIERGHPIGLFDVQRMDDGVGQGQQLLAARVNRERHLAGRVARRVHGHDAGHDLVTRIDKVQQRLDGRQIGACAGQHHGDEVIVAQRREVGSVAPERPTRCGP